MKLIVRMIITNIVGLFVTNMIFAYVRKEFLGEYSQEYISYFASLWLVFGTIASTNYFRDLKNVDQLLMSPIFVLVEPLFLQIAGPVGILMLLTRRDAVKFYDEAEDALAKVKNTSSHISAENSGYKSGGEYADPPESYVKPPFDYEHLGKKKRTRLP